MNPRSSQDGAGTRPEGWRLLSRLGLLTAVAGAVRATYVRRIEPWFHDWGATEAEIRGPWPGDERVSGPVNTSTRALTIRGRPEDIWPWLVQMGQGRGGLYSYELLENLAGSDLHNADRIHPEWQDLKVGDVIRPVPRHYLGLEEGPRWTVAALEPERALVLEGFATFILEPIDERTTRLIVRAHPPAGKWAMEPFNFIMGRRTMQGIQERVEGHPRPRAADVTEVLLWTLAFSVSVGAGVGVLRWPDWRWPLAVHVAAAGGFLTLLFARPPLWLGALLDGALLGAFFPAWKRGRRGLSLEA